MIVGTKRLVSLVLVFTMVFSMTAVAFADDYNEGYIAGQRAGEQHPTGAMGWSFAWGTMFGLWGGLGSFAYYALSDPEPGASELVRLQDTTREYREGFVAGFKKAAGAKATNRSAIGAGLGVVTSALIVASLYASYYNSYNTFSTQGTNTVQPAGVEIPIGAFAW